MTVDRGQLRRFADEAIAARRYTVEHFGRNRAGKYVGKMPAEEYDAAVEALAKAVPELLDLLDRCAEVLVWPASQHCRGEWVRTSDSLIVEWQAFCPDEDCGHGRARALLADLRTTKVPTP